MGLIAATMTKGSVQRLAPQGRGLSVQVTSDVAVSSGSYPSGVSWTLTCTDGSTLSGSAPYSGALSVTAGSECTLAMADSHDDEWIGASWVGFGQDLTLATGYSGQASFVVVVRPPSPLSALLHSPAPPQPIPPAMDTTAPRHRRHLSSTTFDFNAASSAGWLTGVGGAFDFTRRTGGTPSDGTGPSAGYGGSGYYFFAETSSPRSPGDLFTLAYNGSACSDPGDMVSAVAFQYHMYGRDIGTLRLVDAAGLARWTLAGDQGNAWQTASVALYSTSFQFEYMRGSGY